LALEVAPGCGGRGFAVERVASDLSGGWAGWVDVGFGALGATVGAEPRAYTPIASFP